MTDKRKRLKRLTTALRDCDEEIPIGEGLGEFCKLLTEELTILHERINEVHLRVDTTHTRIDKTQDEDIAALKAKLEKPARNFKDSFKQELTEDEEFLALEQAVQNLSPDWQAGCPPDIKKVLEAACILVGEPLNRLMDEETGKPSTELPMQPIEMDSGGIIRFKGNGIVRYLLDAGPFDMNQIAVLPNITREEASQFAQLIGYSVSGYGDLSYAVRVEEADAISDGVVDANRCPGPVKSGHTCKLPAGHDGMHEIVAAKGVKRCRETHEFHECQLAHDHDGPHSESGNTWSSVATE